jgi:hypothetical protein
VPKLIDVIRGKPTRLNTGRRHECEELSKDGLARDKADRVVHEPAGERGGNAMERVSAVCDCDMMGSVNEDSAQGYCFGEPSK